MQIILDSQNRSVVKTERGEDALVILKTMAKEKDASFSFAMIGACSFVELGYYDFEKREYFSKEFREENMEIVSVNGNVAWNENEPIVHAHGVFSNEKYKCFGGHISRLTISITGEVVIDWLPEKIMKRYDKETGLKLLAK
mgnify:FL=1